MLTRKQHELLLFIQNHLDKTGIPPSFDEMKEALALASKSGIHRLIGALEERGFIRRLPNRARALEVVRLPENDTSHSKHEQAFKSNNVRNLKLADDAQPHYSQAQTVPVGIKSHTIQVPVMGRIAAGVPIAAIQHQTNLLSLPADMVGNGEHYALEVKGDSMIEAGIFDGDTAIIKQGNIAHSGEIIVALVDDEEATLKKYQRRGKTIILEAANPAYETRSFNAERIRIQGKLVGLMRRY